MLALPSVRRLWVNSEDDRLVLQWDVGHISLPVSEVANEWATDAAHPTSSHWKRVNGSTRSTVLKGKCMGMHGDEVDKALIPHVSQFDRNKTR